MKEQKKRRKSKRKKIENDILETRDKDLRNRETNIISIVFVFLFLGMVVYLCYFNIVQAKSVIDNPYNKRVDNMSLKVKRGDIVSADGTILATSVTDESGNEVRTYPFGKIYAHAVGFNSDVKMGIEANYNYQLLSSNTDIFEQIVNDITGKKAQGNTVVTTLDSKLSEAAYEVLGDNKGAVIAVNPLNGQILAMVSNPSFDPNEADEKYDEWNSLQSADSVLLNRATQGLYPPGSTFKILSTLEYIRENPDYDDFLFDCSGTVSIEGGSTISCFDSKVHGMQNLEQSLANSCNGAFSKIGVTLDKNRLRDLCSSFFFNEKLAVDFEYKQSIVSFDENSSLSEMQETAIGQGKTMITPLLNLCIISAVANNGDICRPYIVDKIVDYKGNEVKKYSTSVLRNVMSEDETEVLKKYLRSVITEGTGSAFADASYEMYGKTGSAQYDQSDNHHSWFVGFTTGDNPIAICVILEGGYSGGSAQVCARKILDSYYD
ncbi:MAG: peptidoglycan D,D-transpeptidase FtsI family protein [Lachnospira sp.]